ncbi:MAG: sulfate adenylyltransferase [Proteobacteria bacterium]|nr:sulfate adenylyltransferase [Pseudomonadota bacterium]MBU4258533.1 sulfate adenylyltransferase [Pseudomonadota bacterium]MBU4287323.1 sulfate adenylyltransferase [Pseudomonadota bacterium]MBU4414048.1 sulfate adenylyltransferase [Pseudomonadota bacterium]
MLRIDTPPPHGGRLEERVVRDPELGKKLAKSCAATYDIKPTLSDGVPIRNVYREIMSICYGFFSPVEGSMKKAEVERILKERRLLNNWIFPYPLVFDITEEELKDLGVTVGDRLLLRLKGKPFAMIDIEEIWRIDNAEKLATKTFGTPEDNPEVVQEAFNAKMPGWVIYKSLNPVVLAGKYTIINEPTFLKPFDRFWLPPVKSREEYARRGWKTVINHQTRNVPHIGHEFLMKDAGFTGDIEPCHGIQVNAIIGVKRAGDYPDEAIIEGHEAVNLGGYIKPERHIVTFTLWDMRYGNPLESMLHGIIRQNMGCTHHMFGRDHAAVGEYYEMFATQTLWSVGIPSFGFPASVNDVPYGLLIRPQNMREFWYCPVCNEIAYSECCGHTKEKQKFSGSFVRGMVAEGIFPPKVIFRPEVYKVIVKWWKEFNYPFCNAKYVKEKELRLEVDLPDMDI